jgi:hypothetical protein
LGHGSSGRVLAQQALDPEFKPIITKKKKKIERNSE